MNRNGTEVHRDTKMLHGHLLINNLYRACIDVKPLDSDWEVLTCVEKGDMRKFRR